MEDDSGRSSGVVDQDAVKGVGARSRNWVKIASGFGQMCLGFMAFKRAWVLWDSC